MMQYLAFELWGVMFWIISSLFFIVSVGVLCTKDFDSYFYKSEYSRSEINLIGGLAIILIFFAILAGLSSFNVFVDIYHNPLDYLTYGLGYLMIGVGWSLFKWATLCRNVKRKFVELKSNFIKRQSEKTLLSTETLVPTISNDDKELLEYIRPFFGYCSSLQEIIPNIDKNKDIVASWILYWPWHVLSYTYYLLLEDVVNFLQFVFKTLYKKITSFVFRDFIAS